MKLTVHYELCVEAREHVDILIDQADSVQLINKYTGHLKNLFKIVECHQHNKSPSNVLSCDSYVQLANKFNANKAKRKSTKYCA